MDPLETTKSKDDLVNEIKDIIVTTGKEPETKSRFYRVGKLLGRGAFGKVSLGMHKVTNQLVAIKSINKEFLEEERSRRKVAREVAILKKLQHPNIINLYETFETDKHFLLVTELCPGGDLLNYVRRRRKLTEDVAKYFFKQLVHACIYCHKKGVVHRDIKLDNILLDQKGTLKLGDFGVSRAVKKNEILKDQCGTPAYIAPEVLHNNGYSGKLSDTWSCGVVLFAMLYGTVPFKGTNMDELHALIKNGTYTLKDDVSKEARKLIKSILEVNPNKRIKLKEILLTQWLEDTPETIDVFTENEKETIKKELIYANTRRINRNFGKEVFKDIAHMTDNSDVFPFFTEHQLDSTQNSLVRNRTTKSVILAPFNSTLTHISEDINEPKMFKKSKIIRFGVKVKDIDRQYEANNNCELDNGVFNEFIQKTDSDDVKSIKDSISSLKRSFDGAVLETEEDEDIESIASDHFEFDERLFDIMEK